LPPNSSATFKIGKIQSDEVDRYRGDITNISTKPDEFQNESTGINKNERIFTAGKCKIRVTIIIINTKTASILITKLSDEDTVLVEIIHENL